MSIRLLVGFGAGFCCSLVASCVTGVVVGGMSCLSKCSSCGFTWLSVELSFCSGSVEGSRYVIK
jgi:hypothetical protein